MAIGSIDAAAPATVGQPVGNGAQEIRGLKADIKASFTGFTVGNDVCTRTAQQINNAPDKTGAETISGNWNHTGTLKVGGADVALQTVVPSAYEPAIGAKGTAFNRNFATTYGGSSNDVARADHNHVYLATMYKATGTVAANGTKLTGFDDAQPFSGAQLITSANLTKDAANGRITIGLFQGYYQVSLSATVANSTGAPGITTFHVGTSSTSESFQTTVNWGLLSRPTLNWAQANIFATGVFAHSGAGTRLIEVWAVDASDPTATILWKNVQVIVNRLA